jgi:formate dehydrogenase assembly factor FdhD
MAASVHLRGAHAVVRRGDGFEDLVAVEEPLEIRVDGQPLAVTMRTSLAADRGMTLCGFARDGRMNVYTGAQRVT